MHNIVMLALAVLLTDAARVLTVLLVGVLALLLRSKPIRKV
jgi:hypothetical protein